MRLQRVEHEFVEFIPSRLDPGKLYICIPYATAAHLCCCGCGFEVSTPITPTDWALCFDGESVSLAPSIGNSSFPCRSHYWIQKNRVWWEPKMTQALTELSRRRDTLVKSRKYWPSSDMPTEALEQGRGRKTSLLERVRRLFRYLAGRS